MTSSPKSDVRPLRHGFARSVSGGIVERELPGKVRLQETTRPRKRN